MESNEEINRYIATEIMGLTIGYKYCANCGGKDISNGSCNQRGCEGARHVMRCGDIQPDYCSSLDAILPIWEKFGFAVQPSGLDVDGRTARWYVGYIGGSDRADMALMSPENTSVTSGQNLAETLARSAVEAHKASKEQI